MRRLLPLLVVLTGLAAAAPASAITTVTRADATITITGDDTASTVRVLQQDDLTIAVQAVTGETGPPPPGCGASDDTVSCQGVTTIVANLGGGVDDYKGSVDPAQTVDGGAGDDVIEGAAIKLDVTTSASCTAKVSLRVAAKQAKKLGFAKKTKTLGTSTAAVTAGKPTRVSVTVKRAFRKRLRKARKVKATLAVSCGTGATDTASVTLKR